MVECNLPKVDVAGSSPVVRSNKIEGNPQSYFITPQRYKSSINLEIYTEKQEPS